jgi:hypothetical protein
MQCLNNAKDFKYDWSINHGDRGLVRAGFDTQTGSFTVFEHPVHFTSCNRESVKSEWTIEEPLGDNISFTGGRGLDESYPLVTFSGTELYQSSLLLI